MSKIIKLKAGLGNQMFQYAFYRLLELKYQINDIYLDTSYYSHPSFKKYLEFGIDKLCVNYRIAKKSDLKAIHTIYNSFKPHHFFHRLIVALQSKFNKNYYFEKNRAYINIETILNYSYFDGYWQSWRYIEPIKQALYLEFKPKNGLSNLSIKSIYKYKELNSVFVGIRKGDYSSSKKNVNHYGTPSIDYYKKAIEIIYSKVHEPFFIIFSDDIEWVKHNIDFKMLGVKEDSIEFRNDEFVFSSFEEMFVMASCKHAIISNSTFNFWGAWLLENNNKIVVAPKEWFKDGKPIDIIPPNWIKI